MNKLITQLLDGQYENHIFPFFWQHGEDEETLRKYMDVIDKANCKAVCVESRPHPDFCGDKWWQDMDVILDEAVKRNMKVWILDDSHFPTGFANGKVKDAPLNLHRQSICANTFTYDDNEQDIELSLEGLIPPELKPIGLIEGYVYPTMIANAPHFDDDKVIGLTAVNHDTKEVINFDLPSDGILHWHKPKGKWTLWVVGLSRNCGPHRDYINMLEPDSVKILIDEVYEKHYQHYAKYFGNTIEGFFSDEPELGNGHLYFYQNYLGTDQDLPFSDTLSERLKEVLGDDWQNQMYLLWDNEMNKDETSKVRFIYMDELTKLVRQHFSRQIGDWCRNHNVKYIGHMIEDDNAHSRTGSSLGHYFRGLDGQDMSGIDDIGGQVLPQGEDEPTIGVLMSNRDGTFYHFMLGNLAASSAAIQPSKKGNSMCEIFGNYGWAEGVRLEKYLADHFLVRGINNFVPHAFSAKAFPDEDCPPHFYAHGNNPLYRHFGMLMGYMNRICNLTSNGHRVAPVAILYHGESEWMGKAMLSQVPARILAEAQIEYDTIPSDVFKEKERYQTVIGNKLKVNTQQYEALIIPECEYITKETIEAINELDAKGFPIYFINQYPKNINVGKIIHLEDLNKILLLEVKCVPSNKYLRVMHYQGDVEFYFFVNEGKEKWQGEIEIPYKGEAYWYDAYLNKIYPAKLDNKINMTLEPLHSYLLILDTCDESLLSECIELNGEKVKLDKWNRSVCKGIEYPAFIDKKEITLPDSLVQENPSFSGFVCYETNFELNEDKKVFLEITDAYEGVEVFVNDISLGIQIVPPFIYDLTNICKKGNNNIRIEVATTLDRMMYDTNKDDPRFKMRGLQEPKDPIGIIGEVNIYLQ